MSIGINNNGTNVQYPYNQQNQQLTQQQKDNFGALSPETQANLQKVSASAKETAQDSWFGNILKGFGIEDPKKAAISILGAVGVVFGLSAAMNKAVRSGKIFELGKHLDNFAQKNKVVKNISDGIKNTLKPIKKKFSKSDFAQLKGHILTPKNSMAKPILKGTWGEAVDTVTDAMTSMITKEGDTSKLAETLKKLTGKDNVDNLVELVKDVQKNNDLKFENFSKIYDEIKKNPKVLKDGKFNIDKFVGFLSGDDIKGITQKTTGGIFVRQNVNMSDALKKVAILKGDGAKTGLGQKAQQILLRGVEGMSNGVTSRSLMGLLMGLGIYNGVFNKAQDAPKGEKVSTFAEEAVGDMGSYMLFPVAGSLLYGASTLKYLGSKSSQIATYKDGLKKLSEQAANGLSKADVKAQYKALKQGLNKGIKWYQKPIRALANFLSTGLEDNPANGKVLKKLKGIGGGAMRFALVMFAISPLLIKPVMAACHKIFGKPTNTNYPNKQDKIRQQQEEAMKQLQNMTPEQQYQALVQLSQLPEIANNPQQKAYVDQMLAIYQAQIQQQPLQQPNAQQGTTAPTIQPVTPQVTPNAAVQPQPTATAPAASQPISPSMNQNQSIDAGRTYIPSDEPGPGLARRDLNN